MSTDLLLTICSAVSLFLWLKNSISKIQPPPSNFQTDSPWLKFKTKVSYPVLYGQGGWFVFFICYCLQIRKVVSCFPSVYFSLDFKKKSGHWKGKVSIPEGKHLHFSSHWETISQIINRLWSTKSKVSFIKSEISSMNETDFCSSEVMSIKSYSLISGTFLPSVSFDWVLSVVFSFPGADMALDPQRLLTLLPSPLLNTPQ